MTETGGTIATEAGHWYQFDGTPAYTVIGRNGEQRPTTLRDARKLDLVPSVSMIMQCAAAPALENWKRNQLLMAALTLSQREDEGIQAFADRIVADSQEQAAKARDLGTQIHGEIERAMTDTVWIPRPEASAAIKTLGEWGGLDSWRTEKSFTHIYGYGGKVDAHKQGYVADFKTKDFTELNLPKTWDNHAMQLAAYAEGLNMLDARCAIIFVSTTVPGLTHLVEIPEDEITRGWNMFVNLLWYWQEKNRYWPKIAIGTEEELI